MSPSALACALTAISLLSHASPASAQECSTGPTGAYPQSCKAQPAPQGDYACDCSGEVLAVAYDSTEIGCCAFLTVEQTQAPPLVTYAAADITATYTLLLVNTDDSIPVGPILHFGAVNVPGADLISGYDASSASFNGYRGPDPPAYLPGSYRDWYTYVWVVMEQTAGQVAEPTVDSNLFFQIDAFRSQVGLPAPVASAVFISGLCVHPEGVWCPSFFPLRGLCNFVRGPSGCF